MSSLNVVVGIMTRLDGPVLESRQVQGLFFPLLRTIQTGFWVHTMGTGCIF